MHMAMNTDDSPVASRPPRNLALDDAADALADWGFLAQPGQPSHTGPGYLLVAIRQRPTLTHFDPETVSFWISQGGAGQQVRLDHQSAMPFEAQLAWGPIRITDRLHVSNEYLTFGGAITAAREEALTFPESRRARLTSARETPARRATSSIVGFVTYPPRRPRRNA